MGFLNLTKEMTTDSRWGWSGRHPRRLRRKNLGFPAGRAAGQGVGYPPAHAAGECPISPPSEMACTHRDGFLIFFIPYLFLTSFFFQFFPFLLFFNLKNIFFLFFFFFFYAATHPTTLPDTPHPACARLWSVTGSPLKKLICQATMSSLGSGVLVQ